MVEIKDEDIVIEGYDKEDGGDWCPETEKDSGGLRDFHLVTSRFKTFNEAKQLKQQILQNEELRKYVEIMANIENEFSPLYKKLLEVSKK